MAFSDKIQVIIEVLADKAGNLKNFGKDLDDTSSKSGKFKDLVGGAFESIKANAGALALGAGAALVGFAAKATQAFTETALNADRFASSTGQSTEAASRWLAVMGQSGVELGDLQDVFNNVASKIAANDPIFDELGISIAKTSSGATDMNETMLGLVESIAAIEDPAKRAAAASTFFGEEGARQFTELIAKGKDVRQIFADVSDAQVIDVAEVQKAREMQETMRDLENVMKDTFLTVGEELTPAFEAAGDALVGLAPLAIGVSKAVGFLGEGFSDIAEGAEDVGQAIGGLIFGTGNEVEALRNAEKAAKDHFLTLSNGATTMQEFTARLDEQGIMYTERALLINMFDDQLQASNTTTEEAIEVTKSLKEEMEGGIETDDLATQANKALADQTRRTNEALEDQREATEELVEAKADLVGGDIAVRDAQRNAAEAVGALNVLTADGKVGTEEYGIAQDNAAGALLRAAQAAADNQIKIAEADGATLSATQKNQTYILELGNLARTLDPNSDLFRQITGYITQLNNIPRTVATDVILRGTGNTAGGRGVVRSAVGDPFTQAGSFIVGEEGPELIDLPRGSTIHPNRRLRNMQGGSTFITMNFPAGISPEAVNTALRKHMKRNGY